MGSPLRGRYLALQPLVDACALPQDKEHLDRYEVDPRTMQPGAWSWQVYFVADNGHLVPRLAPAGFHEPTATVRLPMRQSCERARASEPLLYFIPEHAKTPYPFAAGQELWVEVTVPATGPPRPLQLALADKGSFKPLPFN